MGQQARTGPKWPKELRRIGIGVSYDSVVRNNSKAARWSRFGRPPYAAVRRLAAGAQLEVNPRMTESSDTSDTPARPQDYAGLRTELATLVDDFTPVISELWPRLEDHRYRWELHSYGLPEGYDKLIVTDIIALLIEALKGIGGADNKLLQAHTKADHHKPSGGAA